MMVATHEIADQPCQLTRLIGGAASRLTRGEWKERTNGKKKKAPETTSRKPFSKV